MVRRFSLGTLLVACTLGPAACATGAATSAPDRTVGAEAEFSVLTLNIWHNQQDWPARLERIVEGIRALDPDVIGLQEVLQNDSLPNQAATLADALGYDVHFTSIDPPGNVTRYGNAILTRHEVLERGWHALDPEDDYRTVAHVRIAVDGIAVDIYDTHLHHTAEGAETRRVQILDLLDFIDLTRGSGPVVLLGDFNAPVDAAEMAPVRDRFADALAAIVPDVADTATTLNPAKGHTARRIDHVFFRQGTASTLRPSSASVVLDAPAPDGVWPSDHFGVYATFELEQDEPGRGVGDRRETNRQRAERRAAESQEARARAAVAVEELMVGRFPGVRVYQSAGGGVRVRLWAPGSFTADPEPLYVVDGMTVQVDAGRGLYWLNPADIADIQVLKDVSAMAMYGVRGANGVVVITTRRGEKKPRN